MARGPPRALRPMSPACLALVLFLAGLLCPGGRLPGGAALRTSRLPTWKAPGKASPRSKAGRFSSGLLPQVPIASVRRTGPVVKNATNSKAFARLRAAATYSCVDRASNCPGLTDHCSTQYTYKGLKIGEFWCPRTCNQCCGDRRESCDSWGALYCDSDFKVAGQPVATYWCPLTCLNCCYDYTSNCDAWGTQYCGDNWTWQDLRVNTYWCPKMCGTCSSGPPVPSSPPPPATPDLSQIRALLEVGQAWMFNPWAGLTQYSSCADFSDHGVVCDPSNRVLEINLGSTFLRGPISSAIGELTNLRILDLSSSVIIGSLPEQITSLINLQSLDLTNNYLLGPIPDGLANLNRLTYLDLSSNSLTGSIPPLGSAQSLKVLDLSSNQLLGPPPDSFSLLGALSYLDLSQNTIFDSLPSALLQLQALAFLGLKNTTLMGSIPREINLLVDLASLDLSYNQLVGTLPAELGALRKLAQLRLQSNHLSGPLPQALSGQKKLTVLRLYMNTLADSMSNVVRILGNLPLATLDVGENRLFGSLPDSLSRLSLLTYLSMENNILESSLPPSISALVNLQYLNAYGNFLSDSLPSGMSRLTALTTIYLFDNMLTGPIDVVFTQFGGLARLQILALDANQFSGTIPPDVSKLSSLAALFIQGNQLTGSLPAQISSLTGLSRLALGWNLLSGSIPAGISRLTRLTYLRLVHNMFSGPLPNFFKELTGLRILNLAYNQFTGTVPYLSQLSNLVSLHLRDNQLTGAVPTGLLSIPDLEVMSNYFTSSSCGTDVSMNCLLQKNCSQVQRSPDACAQFCNTTAPQGPCAGQGSCSLQGPNSIPTCTCNSRYYAPPSNLGTCVLNPGGTPPPPPANLTSNQSLGASLESLTPMASLNPWSRYLSVNYIVSNDVVGWNIPTFSAWMAKSSFFISRRRTAAQGGTTPSGILTWGDARDQGTCAACWAFSSADAVSAAFSIANSSVGGAVPALSPAQIRLCTNKFGGCSGDFPTNALDYATTKLLVTDNVQMANASCTAPALASKPPQTVMYEAVAFRGWLGLLLTLQAQPAIVILDATSNAFQRPLCSQGFVLGDPACYTGTLSHSVVVVGYDINVSPAYWLIRNSWGTLWCTEGHMRLAIQGGDGVCGMHQLPAYYPIPAPQANDPCYTKSTVPNGFTRAALNPCGGGICNPNTDAWGPYGYTCDCSGLNGDFVAVNNKIKITLPGAGLGITQTCVPVDACGLSLVNPCRVGTCVNDGAGGYSCICPLGYFQSVSGDGAGPTCTFGTSATGNATYTIQPGASCGQIAAAYQLTVDQLKQKNPMLVCSDKGNAGPINSTLDVSNPSFSCSVAYSVPFDDVNCQAVANRVLPSGGVALGVGSKGASASVSSPDAATLQSYNPSVDCGYLIPGQLLCLQPGQWRAPPICTSWYTMRDQDTCKSVTDQFFPSDPIPFYWLNPGINCGATAPSGPASILKAQGTEVCVGGETQIGTNLCSKLLVPFPYKKQTGTCKELLANKALKFKNRLHIETVNKPFRFKCAFADKKMISDKILCRPK